ncbi:MAG: hypothetical protein U0587_00205 [Candidatus Binatia bacterium]
MSYLDLAKKIETELKAGRPTAENGTFDLDTTEITAVSFVNTSIGDVWLVADTDAQA